MRVFRALRRRLLAESRFSRYLAYAVGEIVLVVIGILIAVEVNDWARQRSAMARERAALTEIRDALARDMESAASALEINTRKLEAIGEALEYVAGPEDSKESFWKNMDTLGSYALFTADKVAFENLVSVDSLGLIRNRGLRLTLASYYVATEREAAGTPERVRQLARSLTDAVAPLEGEPWAAVIELGLDFEPLIEPAPGSSLKRSSKIAGILTNMVFATRAQSADLRDLQALAEAAIAEIDAYLGSSRETPDRAPDTAAAG